MLDRLRKITLPWHKPAEGGEITPGARTVPAGVLVFDGENKDLWWVKVILNVGRPVVAVIVLVMCAPGEHYLARLAGWSHWLAWGMPATLTAYAGIAAVVATKRPKKSPGKKTAVAGAIISVLLAMGAQPIAHLYQQGLITGHLTLLTIITSCIPALVFGHLLHMAAAPVGTPRPAMDPVDHIAAAFDVPREMIEDPLTPEERARVARGGWRGPRADHVIVDEVPAPMAAGPRDTDQAEETEPDAFDYSDAMTYRAGDQDGMPADLDALRRPHGYTVPADLVPDMWTAPVGTPAPDTDARPGTPWRQALADHIEHRDMAQEDVSRALVMSPDVSRDTDTLTRDNGTQSPLSVPSDVPAVVRPAVRSRTGITAGVRSLLSETPDMTDDEIKAAFPDKNPESVRKSIKRVRDEMKEGS